MAYRNHHPRSRKYNNRGSHSNHPKGAEETSIQPVTYAEPVQQEQERKQEQEKKSSNPLSFLSSLLGTGERAERSGSPLFNIFNYDIFLDDLLLIGLIFLLMTEKDKDEILLIVLVYLLLDIF